MDSGASSGAAARKGGHLHKQVYTCGHCRCNPRGASALGGITASFDLSTELEIVGEGFPLKLQAFSV